MNKVVQDLNTNFVGPSFFYLLDKTEHLLFDWVEFDKPHLVLVFEGRLSIESIKQHQINAGHFILFLNLPKSEFTPDPTDKGFCAVIIRFEDHDWQYLEKFNANKLECKSGKICSVLNQCIAQFIDWIPNAPPHIGCHRRSEILHLLLQVSGTKSGFTESVLKLLSENMESNSSIKSLSQKLFISESTFVRRLRNEGTTLQLLKDRVRLEKARLMLKNTNLPLYLIANECGYKTQSKFSQRFKLHFDITPSHFRKMQDKSLEKL